MIKSIRKKLKLAISVMRDKIYQSTSNLTSKEIDKRPFRTEIINYFLSLTAGENYLEIGTRNPDDNYNKIMCKNKISVDPGVEFEDASITYKLTSDDFFHKLSTNVLKDKNNIRFDVIFIDGLHTANQVDRDIKNSLDYIKDDGFIILHDCNPPTEYHQREDYYFQNSPARGYWNGTTWKAFYKYRHHSDLYSICFDTDWGVGILVKQKINGFNRIDSEIDNPYFEYREFHLKREEYLNLQDFEAWKQAQASA